MDTKKMRWVSGNSVIEMSYIMPLFFSLFVIIIHTVFYYHDKAIIGGAAAESAVMGAQYVRRYDKNYDIEAFFQEKIAVCAPVLQMLQNVCYTKMPKRVKHTAAGRFTRSEESPENKCKTYG